VFPVDAPVLNCVDFRRNLSSGPLHICRGGLLSDAIDSFGFACGTCGRQLKAKVDQGGRSFRCPGCGAAVEVPQIAVVSKAATTPPPGTDVHLHGHTIGPTEPESKGPLKVPSTIGQLLMYLLVIWLGLSLILGVVSLFSTLLSYLSLLLFLGLTAGTVIQMYWVMRARQQVLSKKDIPLLWGFARLIAWDPVEGVLFLKNKKMGFFDDDLHDGHGGVRFIYPIFGDELALRVPLEVQTVQFFDEKVLTREYLSVTVHGTLKWRITDIRKFYLLLSRELRNTSDYRKIEGGGYITPGETKHVESEEEAEVSVKKKLQLAIMWLRVLAEEQARTVVSRVSSGLLIADRLVDQMPEIKDAVTRDRSLLSALASDTPATAGHAWNGAADGLARSIFETMSKRVAPYGINIDEVSLQEIKLPDEIVRACVDAAQTAYLPLLSQRKAAADVAIKRANLAAEVELLGREAIGTREIASAAPAFTLVDFLSNFVSKGMNVQAAAGLAATAATVGVVAKLPEGPTSAALAAATAANASNQLTNSPPPA
jgi:regulator of protease activity HflC (stomatin/prohibitin superfamily)